MEATRALRLFFSQRWAHLLFWLALICAAVACCAGLSAKLDDVRILRTLPLSFETGWVAVSNDGERALTELSRSAAGCEDTVMRLANRLPDTLPGNVALCLQTKNETVRVWVDGVPVYDYGEDAPLIFGHGVGAVWNIVPLPEGCGGGRVEIELTPVDIRTGTAPYTVLLGCRSDIAVTLLERSAERILICALLLTIGVVALLLSGIYLFTGNDRAGAVFHFASFVLLAALWTATDGGLMQFFLPNKGVSYLLFGCSFYLFCTPFALFMADLLPERRRLFRGFAAATALYATLRIALFVGGAVNFEVWLWLLHLLMAVMILTTNLTIWLPVLRTKKTERPEILLAVSVFTVISAISLVSFYVQDKLDVQRNGYASGFYLGILLFVLITIAGAARRARILHQQAFKADFFEKRAYTDDLTGLLNAKGFDDKGAALLPEVGAERCCVLVDFDVNFFSQYNANNGWDAGDALLLAIAARLRDSCREGELCARLEADHFVCLLLGGSLTEIIGRIDAVERDARERMSARLLLVSYGVVEIQDRSLGFAELRNQAVMAKRTVKGNYEQNMAVYDRRLHEAQIQEMALLSSFEAELKNGSYVIYLQPKIYADTEKLGGAEALVRRIEPDGSVVSAGYIIELLERKGFVAKLDFHVLELLCRLLHRCLAEGRNPPPISCNFSRVHLYDPTFTTRVTEIADRYRVPHSLVEIELTETVFLTGKDVLQATVRRLHLGGFRVSIDDFGSGYSSLNMLKDVDVDIIKLDRGFLEGVMENSRARTIVENTLRLAQELSIGSVAEGIETREQLDFLKQLGCNLIQGYYFSRPLPEEKFVAQYLPHRTL